MEWVWEAFHDLNQYRTWTGTMGGLLPNPIALSEIRVYTEMKNIFGEDETDLIYFIRELDAYWCKKTLESMNSKSKSK